MMTEEIRYWLSRESSELGDRLTSYARNRIIASQNYMAQRYNKFQEMELLSRNFRDPDDEDLELESKPLTHGVRKIVVPMSYALQQSLLAWQMQFFTERKPLVPVEGLGANDFHAAILHEHLFEYQWDGMRPRGIMALLQWLSDAHTYGLGIVANGWIVREWLGFLRTSTPFSYEGDIIGRDESIIQQPRVAYEGNQIRNIIPYDFYPDPRFPIARFQEGEFCAYRTRSSHTECDVKEAEGLYVGVRFVPATRQENQKGTPSSAWNDTELGAPLSLDNDGEQFLDNDGKPVVTLHHMYALIPPWVLRLEDPPDMYDETNSELPFVWALTLANMSRIIRLEPANLPHPAFPFSISEPNYNVHAPMNPGMLEELAGPNYHLSWLVNSREANVRRSLNFELLYDPSLVERDDLENPQPSGLVRLKADAQDIVPELRSLDRAVRPMPVADVTQTYMGDVKYWVEVMETLSGVSKGIQGQPASGRRSATEQQHANQMAAARMKLFALIHCYQGMTELCEQQLANTQTFMEQRLQMKVLDAYRSVLESDYVQIGPELLQGNFRIPFMETGIPTDKVFHTNALKEIFQIAMQNPQQQALVAQMLNGPELLMRMLQITGMRNLAGLVMPPGGFANAGKTTVPSQMLRVADRTAVEVRPDEEVAREMERGNLVPYEGAVRPGGNLGTPGIGTEANLYG